MSRRSLDQFKPRRRFVQKLSAYAATSGALVAADASAGIIYTDLGQNGVTVREGTFDVDMNADGLVDFVLRHFQTDVRTDTPTSSSSMTDWTSGKHVRAYAVSTPEFFRGVLVNNGPCACATAFSIGAVIRPNARSRRVGIIASERFSHSSDTQSQFGGNFFNLADGAFVGVSFGQVGQVGQARHAGWIQVEASPPDHFTIFGFAYETEPGEPILAGAVPEPPSLVILASGAVGLGMLRRKRRAMKTELTPSGR